jgi:8-hydroxy-5-deazaflavin:NADPH oxidoreductase
MKPVIAVLGGTGALGSGLARQWARHGYSVIIASRTPEKAVAAAAELRASLPTATVTGDGLAAAASRADIAVLAVPYAAHRETLEAVRDALGGKILIDTTVPLRPPKVGTVQLPAAGCAAVEAQQLLGNGVKVVSAFQNVAAAKLAADAAIECDVLVSGDDVAARDTVIALVEAIGVKAWPAGPLANSAAAEALTSVLIQINRKFGVKGAGLRIHLGAD